MERTAPARSRCRLFSEPRRSIRANTLARRSKPCFSLLIFAVVSAGIRLQDSATVIRSSPDQPPIVEEIAARIVKIAGKWPQGQGGKIRIAVIPLLRQDEEVTELGVILARGLADELSASTQSRIESIAPGEVESVLEKYAIWPADLRSERFAAWFARLLEADAIITGKFEPRGQVLRLEFRCTAADPWPMYFRVSGNLKVSAELREKIQDDRPRLKPNFQKDPPLPGVKTSGKEGVGMPECVHCPMPQFPEGARRAGYSGRVLLRAVVGADGLVTNLRVIRAGPFEMNTAAMEAVGRWRFKPARESDGKPVPSWITLEIMFNLK